MYATDVFGFGTSKDAIGSQIKLEDTNTAGTPGRAPSAGRANEPADTGLWIIGHFSDQLPLKENSNFVKDASTLLIILRE
jgi:hypothetical protein